MAAVNVTANTLSLAGVGPGGSSGDDVLETTNSTTWHGNDTEFDLLANSSGSSIGPVPYHQRLETYLVPFLFALIFIVGVIAKETAQGHKKKETTIVKKKSRYSLLL